MARKSIKYQRKGKRTSLAKTTMTAMLDRMESKGIIARIFDNANRRQINISLTSESAGLKEKYQRISDEMAAVFYKGFTESEIVDFEKKLERIINNLTKKEESK